MKMVRNILIAAILLLNYGYDEVGKNPLAITKAITTNIKKFPFMASIHVDLELVCGGTVINRNLILTAAHCIYNVSIDSLLVCVGSTLSWIGVVDRNVSKVFTHHYYNSSNHTYRNDIGLLLLRNELNYTNEIKPIQLPETSNMTLRVCWLVKILGFGETERGFNLDGLRLAQFTILKDTSCQDQEVYGFPLESSQFCAGDPIHLCELGKGDDGSPIIRDGILIGIVSWFKGIYTVAVRIHDYMDFINSTMKAHP